MPVSLSTIAAKDSAGTAIAGGLQAQDKSGVGTGPFTLGQVLIDGLAGINQLNITAANAAKVDGSAVTQPVSGTVTANIAAAQTLATVTTVSTVTNLSQLGGVAISMGTGVRGTGVQRVTVCTDDLVPVSLAVETTKAIGVVRAADGSGNLLTSTGNALDINIKSGANTNGAKTSANSAPVVIASDQAAIPVNVAAAATGGSTNLHGFSVTGAPAAVVIKASAGTLLGYQAVNTGAAPVYLKFYNKAAASVVVGTDVPLYTMTIPTIATTGAGIAPPLPSCGIAFSTAMSYAFTNVAADNDATAVAVGVTLDIQFA